MRVFALMGATEKSIARRWRGIADGHVQPGTRISPVPLGGPVRDAHHLADLFEVQAGEEMEFDELGLGGFLAREFFERLIQSQQVVVGSFTEAQGLVQADAVATTAMLGPSLAPGVVDEDAA